MNYQVTLLLKDEQNEFKDIADVGQFCIDEIECNEIKVISVSEESYNAVEAYQEALKKIYKVAQDFDNDEGIIVEQIEKALIGLNFKNWK